MSSGYEESRLQSFQDRPEEQPEKTVHLVADTKDAKPLCGVRESNSDVLPLVEYLDWGYDGDGQELCTRCDLRARQIERQGH